MRQDDSEEMTFEEAWDTGLYLGDNEQIQFHVAHVLMSLPPRVREFATNYCTILSVGGKQGLGITWPARVIWPRRAPSVTLQNQKGLPKLNSCWLIVVSDDLPEGEERGIIAHEIAHAYLKHDRTSPELSDDCEEQAAELVRQWGFSGKGTRDFRGSLTTGAFCGPRSAMARPYPLTTRSINHRNVQCSLRQV